MAVVIAGLLMVPVLYAVSPNNPLVEAAAEWTASWAGIGLGILGVSTYVNGSILASEDFAVNVVAECLALAPIMIYSGAVIASPATFRAKIWGIAAGALVLMSVNMVRIVSLFWIGAGYPEYLDFAHLLVWQSGIYLLAIVLWLYWHGRVFSGTDTRLLLFAIRAAALVFAASVVWMPFASQYNRVLIKLVSPFIGGGTTVRAAGPSFIFETPSLGAPLSIDGLTLHWGFILLTALVAAAVGLSLTARIRWLAATVGLMATAHILGVASLSYGLAWLSWAASPEYAADLTVSLFAGFWSLFPFVVGGVWAWRYWLPRSSARQA
ncbi:MAG: hypothetical protein IH861_11340 [Chloroflexi bacterium]|nr:hypothetical protein [Chloroflexota bacterium]